MRLNTVQRAPAPAPIIQPGPCRGHRSAHFRLTCALLLLSAALAACSSGRPAEPRIPTVLKSTIGAPAPTARTSPAVWGAERGLELWSWTVADPRQPVFVPSASPSAAAAEGPPSQPAFTIIDPRISIEQAVAPYIDRPVPIPDELRFRLHAAGLRIVSIPIADLSSLQTMLRLVAPTQKQWLGEVPLWTDLVRGPSFHSPRTITIDNNPAAATTQLQPGRLRLLGRAWIVPLPTADNPAAAALRLELVPQHEPHLSDHQRLLAGISNTRAEAQGRLFPRLAIGTYLRGEDALILIPDSPHSDWSSHTPPAPPAAPDHPADAQAPAAPGAEPPTHESTLNWPSLGEAMLVAPATGAAPRTRAVLVLIPHSPQRFELR
jgi:hypothetical protein